MFDRGFLGREIHFGVGLLGLVGVASLYLRRYIMGQYVSLVYVIIQNPENCSKYIPIIRKFNNDSLSNIRENIITQSHVISLDWDRTDIETKNKFMNTLRSLMDVGALLTLLKDFYTDAFDNKDKREITLEWLKLETDTLSIDEYLRSPIKMEKLIQFSESDFFNFDLYVDESLDVEIISGDTVFYLDDPVDVDDNDNEIYPPFAKKNHLWIYFIGEKVAEIIGNTRHQLCPKIPSIDDYIKNFNYYNKHDCCFTFD